MHQKRLFWEGIRLYAVATCTESPWSNTTSCRTGGGIKFSFKVCRLSVPSHTFHYTAVKVHSHWHCHFYLENVFRTQEAAVERITDTSLACFSVSNRRKLCLHCRHDNQHIPWLSTSLFPSSQNITLPTVITYFCISAAVVRSRGKGEHSDICCLLICKVWSISAAFLLTWKSRWFVSCALTSHFPSHQAPLKSVIVVSTENSVWHISNTL